MDRAEDLIEGLHPDGLASAGPGRPDPAPLDSKVLVVGGTVRGQLPLEARQRLQAGQRAGECRSSASPLCREAPSPEHARMMGAEGDVLLYPRCPTQ